MDTGIVVTGRGEVAAAPDVAVVSLGVSLKRSVAPAAIADAAAAATLLHDALVDVGIAPADLRTSTYAVAPEYTYPPTGGPVADGYRVTNELSVTVRLVDRVGAVIDAATATGPDVVVNGLSFVVADDTAVRGEARDAAFADAERSARQLAHLAGRTLGRVEAVAEVSSPEFGPRPRLAKAAFDTTASPIAPGEVPTAVAVEVRWSFGD